MAQTNVLKTLAYLRNMNKRNQPKKIEEKREKKEKIEMELMTKQFLDNQTMRKRRNVQNRDRQN